MPWFKCLVRGQGFPLTLEGKSRSWSFYANRCVEARDEDAAEAAVVAMLRRDPDLSLGPGVVGRERARLFFEDIAPVDSPSGPNKGFTFFDDEGIPFYES